MSIENYIATLQKTKTFQAGLISFQEYSFKSKIFGMGRALPSVPHADDDRHVVVMEIRGGQPNIFKVLKDKNETIHPTTKDVDKLLFVFIEMRPHTLIIDKTADGYRLSDGHRIDAKFIVTYRIKDATTFWRGNKDQLAEFEIAVTDAAKNFFLGLTSDYLISSPADLKQSLEKQIRETDMGVVKTKLEKSIYTAAFQSCTVAGIELQRVIADVFLSDYLRDHLRRMHDVLYGEGGAAERWRIDKIIDCNTTFAPYKLRDVINTIDMRLLENFYTMKWSEAMRKVTERLAEKKEEYMMSVEHKELKMMHELINAAESLGLDPMDVESLKSKFAIKLLAKADSSSNAHTLSDGDYLNSILSISSTHLLGSNTEKPKEIE